MKTEIRDVGQANRKVAGVFIEYRDCLGNTLGQAVYFDWLECPLPDRGDSLACLTNSPNGTDRRKLHGRVIARHFDVQVDEHGAEQVWVRLEVEIASSTTVLHPRIAFSKN